MRDNIMPEVRAITNRLYELVDDGVLSWETIGRACLTYMSEYDVENMTDSEFDYLCQNDEECDE